MVDEETYTFIGASEDGVPLFMDIAVLSGEGSALRHGERLFEMHHAGDRVEIWRGASLMANIRRPDARNAGDRALSAGPGQQTG